MRDRVARTLARLSLQRASRATRCPPAHASASFGSLRCLSSLQPSAAQARADSSSGASTSTPSSWSYLAALPFALAPIAAACEQPQQQQQGKQEDYSVLGLENKRRIFFKYEKRIRENSTLEKSFEYFSNVEQDGQKFMLPQGLLAALVPTYPASQSSSERAGSLAGERPASKQAIIEAESSRAARSIFDKFDINGDGLMSFGEFQLVLTLLSIPEDDVATIFSVVDTDGSGTIDASEFMLIMDELQSRAHLPRYRAGKEHAAGLLISFFGQDLKGHLQLPAFMSFLRKLHEDLIELEFLHYDVTRSGGVPGIDFARSFVACSDVRVVDSLLNKADNLPPHLRDAQINREEFKALHSLYRKKQQLIVALQFTQKIGREIKASELARIVQQTTGMVLTPKVLDIVYALLGKEDGNLDVQTFIDILVRRDMMYSKDHAAGGAKKVKEVSFKFW